MPVPKKPPPAPISTPAFAQEYTTALGTVDRAGGPPQVPIQADATTSANTDQKLEKSGELFWRRQPTSTPIAPNIAMTRLDPQVEEQRKILAKELEPLIKLSKQASKAFASSLYHDLASAEEIKTFLAETDVYNGKRWALPETHKKLEEDDMYFPLVTLLNAILKHFLEPSDAALRTAIDTHLTQLPHKEPVPTNNTSRPDISVKAEGSSFQLPHKSTTSGIGYSNIITFIEVKVTTKHWTLSEMVLQVAAYARQIFINQPNRRFVRALIVTEQDFRLFHFDRSGAQYTQPIDIHDADHGASTFIRLVLGLCSTYEPDVGLDPSIKWEIVNGRKVSGTLRMRGPKEVNKPSGSSKTRQGTRPLVTYKLASVDPIVSCYNIRGRGATCWEVIDPQSGETLLVRDVWRSGDRPSEDAYLDRAKDIPGVVEMICCEGNRGETKQWRGFKHPHCDFRNRISIRIVMDTHGKSIKHFKSPMELLSALRDAIDGHKELYMRKTLHRDIALDNILLGKPNAPKGYRGLLMGLDMAILNKRKAAKATSTDWKTSTGSYQSVIVLNSGEQGNPLAHDHLDDLESFVYVLTRIMYGYDQMGVEYTLFDRVQSWDLSNSTKEAESKEAYLNKAYVERHSLVEERWPPSCVELLLALKTFVHEILKKKALLANQKPHVRKDRVKQLMREVPRHYKAVLDLFDAAIKKIESGDDIRPATPEPETDVRSSSMDPSSSPGMVQENRQLSPLVDIDTPPKRRPAIQNGTSNLGKRCSEGQPDGQGPTKRLRLVNDASLRTEPRKSSRVKSRAPKDTSPRKRPTGGRRPL